MKNLFHHLNLLLHPRRKRFIERLKAETKRNEVWFDEAVREQKGGNGWDSGQSVERHGIGNQEQSE